MSINSRVLSLLLASSIGLLNSAVLLYFEAFPDEFFKISFLITFIISFILVFTVLEFLFFKELKKLYRAIKRNGNEESTNVSVDENVSLSEIYKEVNDYAFSKEHEIDELKKRATFRRQFLADVSHELKTPIFAAQGFVHTLLDGAIEDKKNRVNFLKKAAKNLDGLDMLVKDLLTVSHMESGDIKMQKESFDIGEMIYDIFDEFNERAIKSEQTLMASCKRFDEVMIYADPRRIYQVLINLISNAIKYTENKALIYVQLDETSENILRITVKDNGLGIPAMDIDRIFERFYRVEKSRSKQKGGTGLGLAIVKHILDAHESEIIVKSILGKGSEFSFELQTSD